MDANEMKAQIHKSADQIENGVAAAAAHLANGAEALDKQSDEVQSTLRDIAKRLLDNTKQLSDELAAQAHSRPLAAFCCAFVAGVIVGRLARRPTTR